ERLVAGTQQTEVGKARLRKYVVTDTETVQVPVSREEVRLEREPITDANRDAAYSGGDITEEEHEITLRAEKPVVGTETEAVERVRLGKETVTDTETVSGEVRKEQIEFDDSTGTARKPR
ncbi:MAG TPA: YsnF/AvaK domain-containing protein, partial [Mycobacteriales bacterium]